MLTGGVAPCLPSWPITKIKLQGKYAGFDTDDCIVFAQDTQTRRECKLLAQIKHAVGITEGDRIFSETILSEWKDFNNPNKFYFTWRKDTVHAHIMIIDKHTLKD